jgi:hypothetical protein
MQSDGVVDQWAFAVESSSPRDFLLLHDLWRTLHRLVMYLGGAANCSGPVPDRP